MKRQGFVKTPYPIILSLENHCSLAVQDRIAELLETILGDMIAKPASGIMGQLPSPEQLKNKVLVKAKSHATAAVESDLTIQEDGEEVPEKIDLPDAPLPDEKSKISDRLARCFFFVL